MGLVYFDITEQYWSMESTLEAKDDLFIDLDYKEIRDKQLYKMT